VVAELDVTDGEVPWLNLQGVQGVKVSLDMAEDEHSGRKRVELSHVRMTGTRTT
jgi:hypothetical protein